MEGEPKSIAAEDVSGSFAELLKRVETGGETIDVVREGRVIARIMPANKRISSVADLQRNWETRRPLPPDEADLWLKELEEQRRLAPLPPSPWD